MRSQQEGLNRYPFSRQQRLLTPAQFKAVFDRNVTRAASTAFLLLALPNGGDCSRLGLVVGKKALKRAVDRNRVKRVVREQFRGTVFHTPVDVIFLARPAIAVAPLLATDIAKQLDRLDKRLMVLETPR